MSWRGLMLAAALLAGPGVARGYLVGPPLDLDKLVAESDLVFKGTVVSSAPVQDDWFKPCPDFVSRETRFMVVSVLKGDATLKTIRFRHYDESSQPWGRDYEPQYYHFQTNRTYIVFAKKTADAAIHRQLRASQTGKKDQGVLLCADTKPVTAASVKESLWNELTLLLKSRDADDVTYAIRQVDEMSGGQRDFDSTKDFDRTTALAVIHGLMTNPDPRIAQAAITVIGSCNPYLLDRYTEYWLTTVGSAELPGLGRMDPKMRNLGGELYWKELESIASGKYLAESRALALRALGLVRQPVLRESINRWLADQEAPVRAAAALLLSDFPGPDANRSLIGLAADPEPVVRACVARAIGYSQQQELIDLLGKLLADKDKEVRRTASLGALSFSPKNESVARLFRSQLKAKEFEPLFLNALAREEPEQCRDALARAVTEQLNPSNWTGGEIPAFTAWKILFKYLRAQPTELLNSGKLDRYLDALEKVGNYSSSEPRDIYAFYVLRGMSERAKSFRVKANKAASYDLDYFFKQVDEHPANYQGE